MYTHQRFQRLIEVRDFVTEALEGEIGAQLTGILSEQASDGVEVDGVGGRVNSIIAMRPRIVPKGSRPFLEAESVHGLLDAVGGELFGPCVAALRPEGVLCLVGAIAGGDVAFDAWQLIRPVTLTGYSTETLDGRTLRGAVAALSG